MAHRHRHWHWTGTRGVGADINLQTRPDQAKRVFFRFEVYLSVTTPVLCMGVCTVP